MPKKDKERTQKNNTPLFDPIQEELEGLGENEDGGLGEYPIDTLLIRKETRTVYDVVRRIKRGDFIMDPDFQRDFVWSSDKQSKLIESVLMRIPLPVFYLAEDKDGRTIVVDGLQRLSTFHHFLENRFSLELQNQEALNEKKFEELSPKLRNRVEDCNLELYIIDSKVPEQAKLDIFERVNSGELLTRQQMRNCLYVGPATKWLKGEATSELFQEATGKSLSSKTMRDREFVNRFCAFFLLDINNYKGDMDRFLAESLQLMNKYSEKQFNDLSKQLKTTLQNNQMLFERHAFRKHVPGQTQRNSLNASLWDVMSTGLARYPKDLIETKAKAVQEAFYNLLNNHEFVDAITYGTNTVTKVKRRFKLANKMFKEVLG
ncbi:MAG: DUF262 domain-containing protein [Planctomycetia bacterium]|jgi:hypothetical protein